MYANQFYGAEILCHYELFVDMHKQTLIHTNTHILVQGIVASNVSLMPSIYPKDSTNPYLTLLAEFSLSHKFHLSLDVPIKHDVTHPIETVRPPYLTAPQTC